MNFVFSFLALIVVISAVFVAIIIAFIVWGITKIASSITISTSTNHYGIQSITQNGELVKSRAEKQIADYLWAKGIRYFYEQSGHYAIRRPDFYLPDFNVYIEYWGLVNADDFQTRENYRRNMVGKMAIYQRHNLRLISIFPYEMSNLDLVLEAKLKETTGFTFGSYYHA